MTRVKIGTALDGSTLLTEKFSAVGHQYRTYLLTNFCTLFGGPEGLEGRCSHL